MTVEKHFYYSETKVLLELVDNEAPFFTVLLHGGDNCLNHISLTGYFPHYMKQRMWDFDDTLSMRYDSCGIKYQKMKKLIHEVEAYPPPSFNLSSAIHHVCGGMSILYESNMGLAADGEVYTAEEILDAHLILFEGILKFTISANNYDEVSRFQNQIQRQHVPL